MESSSDSTLQLLVREAKGASGTGSDGEPSPGQGAQAGTEEVTSGQATSTCQMTMDSPSPCSLNGGIAILLCRSGGND